MSSSWVEPLNRWWKSYQVFIFIRGCNETKSEMLIRSNTDEKHEKLTCIYIHRESDDSSHSGANIKQLNSNQDFQEPTKDN